MLFLTYLSDHGTALLWTPPQIPLSPVPTKAPHHPPLSFRVLLSTLPPCSLSLLQPHWLFFCLSYTFLLFFQLKCKLLRARVRVCLALPPGLGQCLAHASHTVNACGNTDLITKEPMFDEYRTMGLQILSLKIYFIPDKTFYKPYFVKHVF